MSKQSPPDSVPLPNFIRENIGLCKFLLIWISLFVALELCREFLLRDLAVYHHYLVLLISHSSASLDIIGISHELQQSYVHVIDYLDTLMTDVDVRIVVDSSYDGLHAMFLFIAAAIAWPSSLGRKLVYIPLALLTLYALNVARITATVAVQQFIPLSHNLFHHWITPALTIVLPMILLFLIWVRFSGRHPSD